MRRISVLVVVLAALPGTATAERLVDAREVARGDYMQPQWGPHGREVLVTGPQLRGLHVLSGGAVRTLTADAEAGVHARWNPDGSIAFRARGSAGRRDLVARPNGRIEPAAPSAPIAFTADDRMYVRDRAGKVIRIGSGDRFFGAVVAPDGDKVVFQGLTTGLHLYVRSTGVVRYIGPGTSPAWSPDSARLAYEVTEDDGHDVVASDLYIYALAADRATPVTQTDRVIERRPSFSPSGTELAYDDNLGGIFTGRLEAR